MIIILFQFKSKSKMDDVCSPSAVPLCKHGSLGRANTHKEDIASMSIPVKGEFEMVYWVGKFAFCAANYCLSHRFWVFLALN